MEAGDLLFFAPFDERRHGHQNVTVRSVGRKWITLTNGRRVDKETMRVDGGVHSSPGKCWPSKAAWEGYRALRDFYQTFRRQLESNFELPEGVTPARMVVAAGALKMREPDPVEAMTAALEAMQLARTQTIGAIVREDLDRAIGKLEALLKP